MSFCLRDYQVATADSIEEQWRSVDSTIAVLATGMGKSLILAEMIRRRQDTGRALVVAHREELIFQNCDKIQNSTGIHCEIEMADLMASRGLEHDMPVVIATVQTLVSGRNRARMARFNPMDFSTLVFDECHHGCADTWKSVLTHFRQNPALKILGVTATPDRKDEAALGQIFKSVSANIGILEGIESGWLVPVEQQMVTVEGLDFSGVRTTAGDLNGADLAAIMEAEKVLHELCSSAIEICGPRQTIVFTASVKHAEAACNIFNRHRQGSAEWICGTTPKEHRRKIMENMQSGKTQFLCNVGVCTEGFDCPTVEVIVMGRPTKSRSLYAQCAGRATRPLPGVVDGPETAELRRAAIAASAKRNCLLVDYVGNSGRHKLVTGLDLLGGKYPDEVKALADKMLREDGESKDIAEALEAAKERLRAKRQKEAEERDRVEEERKARIKAKATFSLRSVNPFDTYDIHPSIRIDAGMDGVLTAHEKERLGWIKNSDWQNRTFGECKALLREQDRRYKGGLCSMDQAKHLKRFGFDPDMTKAAASKVLDAIASNGWRVPAGMKVESSTAPEMAMAGNFDEPF